MTKEKKNKCEDCLAYKTTPDNLRLTSCWACLARSPGTPPTMEGIGLVVTWIFFIISSLMCFLFFLLIFWVVTVVSTCLVMFLVTFLKTFSSLGLSCDFL